MIKLPDKELTEMNRLKNEFNLEINPETPLVEMQQIVKHKIDEITKDLRRSAFLSGKNYPLLPVSTLFKEIKITLNHVSRREDNITLNLPHADRMLLKKIMFYADLYEPVSKNEKLALVSEDVRKQILQEENHNRLLR